MHFFEVSYKPYYRIRLYFQVNLKKLIWPLWAPAAMVRQILNIVAKNENSTEHFVNLHADYCELN